MSECCCNCCICANYYVNKIDWQLLVIDQTKQVICPLMSHVIQSQRIVSFILKVKLFLPIFL